jgi:hypothetical protein
MLMSDPSKKKGPPARLSELIIKHFQTTVGFLCKAQNQIMIQINETCHEAIHQSRSTLWQYAAS